MLESAVRDSYLEAPDGALIVAAAAIVAAARGQPTAGFPGELSDWLSGKEAALEALAPEALAALDRVRAKDSELRELWEEGDDFPGWCDELDAIADGLR